MATVAANNYLKRPDSYVFPFVINQKNGKSRTIITYKDTSSGRLLREWHEEVLKIISTCYKSNPSSFAYQKRISCKNALDDHLKSHCFIKLDIHSFFESITLESFLKEGYPLINKLCNEQEIETLFYQGHLSLGYVTSPIISDIYLHTFDEAITNYLINKPYLHYSRYCDDILISSEQDDYAELEALERLIEKELSKKGLSLNNKKEKKAHLDYESHNSLSFLGLNLSKKEDGTNRITISKHFILKLLDMLGDYYANYPNCNYIFKNNILSRLAYLKHNSVDSYQRFLKKHLNRFKQEFQGI